MCIYKDYARAYDRSGQIAFSLKMVPYLSRLLARHPVGGKVMLELACGTGTVAIAFAQDGWHVYGVDGSAEMLAEARKKAAGQGSAPLWSQQDMRRLALPERVHLSTCLYDSMNYMLTSDDLLTVFRRVFDLLLPGGLFLFDMNTAWAFAALWDDETYFIDSDDLAAILRSEYDPHRQRAAVTVTCFERVGDFYRKLIEHHTEQAYPPEQIATLLTDVGFQVEGEYDCFSLDPPTDSSYRIMWAARRPHRRGPSADGQSL